MSVDRPALRFGGVNSGVAFTSQTGTQTVRLTQAGTGIVTWTAASSVPWLTVLPSSGSGPATLALSTLFMSGLAPTPTGAITLTFTGAGNTLAPITVTLASLAESLQLQVRFPVAIGVGGVNEVQLLSEFVDRVGLGSRRVRQFCGRNHQGTSPRDGEVGSIERRDAGAIDFGSRHDDVAHGAVGSAGGAVELTVPRRRRLPVHGVGIEQRHHPSVLQVREPRDGQPVIRQPPHVLDPPRVHERAFSLPAIVRMVTIDGHHSWWCAVTAIRRAPWPLSSR